MSDEDVKCEKCGLEITTGLMAGLCQYSTDCPMWPHSDGTPAGDGGELFMAHVWMEQANKQFRIQIEDRARLEREVAALREAARALRNWIGDYPNLEEHDIPDSIWLPFLAALEPCHAQGNGSE